MDLDLTKLRNAYFVMRHGKSTANEQEIIVSDPQYGIAGYPLTQEGRREVEASAEKARGEKILDQSTQIISSDFLRTKETAEIAARVLGAQSVTYTPKLRERFFGQWEAQHNSNYQKVWDEDRVNHTHTTQGVESVADVLERALLLIQELETEFSGQKILLVSHGDTLQILQTVFERVSPSAHRDLAHLKTGEIRAIHKVSV